MKSNIKEILHDSTKVAAWEVKKLIWNKTFIISLLLTPVFIGLFMGLPVLFEMIDEPAPLDEVDKNFTLYIIDEVGIYNQLSNRLNNSVNSQLVLKKYTGDIEALSNRIKGNELAGFVHITENTINTKVVNIVIGNRSAPDFISEFESMIMEQESDLSIFKSLLEQTLLHHQLAGYNINPNEIDNIIAGYSFNVSALVEEPITEKYIMEEIGKYMPGIFAGIVLFMSVFSGMTAMQSAISDKKDKMVEILLSSVSADSLMYGKIIGNFIAGIVQGIVYLIYGLIGMQIIGIPIPLVIFFTLSYELPILLFFALAGSLLFFSMYIGLGATIEDLATVGNFQSTVLSIPFLSLIILGPVIDNPDGTIALIGSYIPITAPMVMIARITLSDLSLIDILLPAIVLVISIFIFSKIASKLFKTGMLMYGKEASLKEIWRWIRQ